MYLPAARAGVIANWPAAWTTGVNWPYEGENDTMEGLDGQACFHFHSSLGGPGSCAYGDYTGWHTFGSNWEPGSVTYYYDGIKVGTITTGITNSPHFLILNQTQGIYGGPTLTPATVLVDYIHIWQNNTTTPTPPTSKSGDANGDGLVDGRDYVIWAGNYNKNITGPAMGDFDNNSIVDGRDYVIWMGNYGK